MRSMTGFGAATITHPNCTMTVQIAAVNHRGIQVHVRNDLRDLALDELIKQEIRSVLQRGSITVQVQVREPSGVSFDKDRVKAAWQHLAELATELQAPMPTIDRVISLIGNKDGAPVISYEPMLREALAQAIVAINKERDREGQALTSACQKHAAALKSLIPNMHKAAEVRATHYRTTVQARVNELLSTQSLDNDQLIRDVALYAERIDVTEELVRLEAHLAALDALLANEEDQVGRKLEFLLQEIGREINTTGAKSNDTTLTNLVLEAKSIIDQIKEQSANVI